jgi:hypothetical protein
MVNLKKVTSDNVYETIHQFVTEGELVVSDYESMIDVILSMIKIGYCFTMDRDILRDAMESLTYMYAPSDDMNKDRLVQQFADEDDDDEEEEGEEDFGNMDLMKMMQMMGGIGGESGMPDLGSLVGESKTESPESESKTVTTDEKPSEVEETTVVKEEKSSEESSTEPSTEESKPTEVGAE